MIPVSQDKQFIFNYSASGSAIEGRNVTNWWNLGETFNASIQLPGGSTGGLEVWVNNSRLYNDYRAEVSQMMFNPWQAEAMQNGSVLNAAFSGSWVNITEHPITLKAPNAFYIQAPFRFIRLGGAGLSGALTSANVAILWTSDMSLTQ